MTHLAGIALGLIFAVIGLRRGFYSMWSTMCNVLIGIYMAVMLTPTLSSYFEWVGKGFGNSDKPAFWYVYAGCFAAIALATFFILEVMALTYFVGTFSISLSKFVNNIGGVTAGFITGYVLWGFICFNILIIPKVQDYLLTGNFATQDTLNRSVTSVSKVVNTANAFSLQPNMAKVAQVIKWSLNFEIPAGAVEPVTPAPAPKKQKEQEKPKTSPNSEEVQIET
jgi:hypothetical protein